LALPIGHDAKKRSPTFNPWGDLFILVRFVMHCVMCAMMVVMDDFLMMTDGFMRLRHRHSCHSHEDQDRQKDFFHHIDLFLR